MRTGPLTMPAFLNAVAIIEQHRANLLGFDDSDLERADFERRRAGVQAAAEQVQKDIEALFPSES